MTKKENSLLSDLDAAMYVAKKTQCLFIERTSHFSEEDKQELAQAMANPRYTTKAITQVCNARGANFSTYATSLHRKKNCCCEFE